MKPPARAVLLGAVLLLAVTGCGGAKKPAVTVAAVTRGTVTEVVDAPATVAARATATLTAPADATVAELLVADGAQVSGGTVLMRLDSPAAQDRLRQAEAADAQAAGGRSAAPGVDVSGFQAQADAAAYAAFDAARVAAASNPDPAQRDAANAAIDGAVARYLQARASSLDSARRLTAGIGSVTSSLSALSSAQRTQTRAAVAVAQQTVDALVVRAPMSGVVQLGGGSGAPAGPDLSGIAGALGAFGAGAAAAAPSSGAAPKTSVPAVAAGLPVSAGATVATVFDTSSLALSAEVDETDVFLVKPGVTARVELDAVPGASYAATVTSVNLAPTTSNRGGVGYRVQLALAAGTLKDGGPAPAPRPGMSAVTRLQVRTAENAITVPAAALVRDGDADSVWVDRAGRAARVRVTLGPQGEDRVAVAAGLADGDRVVVRGADTVREGQQLPR
ncbi:MAG: HlyD family efflux transporter periplasmic adaptor subunit [Actinomycetota bacterium]|nr:HlyD family efflux transporter periplasmic adaptor subunit [Actinomycetota bacterium]